MSKTRAHELMMIYGAVDEKVLKDEQEKRHAIQGHIMAACNHAIEMSDVDELSKVTPLLENHLYQYLTAAIPRYKEWMREVGSLSDE